MTKSIKHDASAPAVSFLIATYNQIAYIEAAVEGALAQNYAPLEIVVTDDGSTDGTWERLKELAAANPALVVTQTPHNLGTLGNLYHGVEHTSGDLLVLAAGDDISMPYRVTRIVREWQATGADALQSAFTIMNDDGEHIAEIWTPPPVGTLQACFPGRTVNTIHGASSAYSRRVFEEIPRPNERILFEDTYFTLFLHLYDRKVVSIDEPLVKYRKHAGATTNTVAGGVTNLDEIRRLETRSQAAASSVATIFPLVLRTLDERRQAFGRYPTNDVDRDAIARNAEHYAFASRWLDLGPSARWSAFRASDDSDHRRWIAARLGGPVGIKLLRHMANMFRS